MKKNRKNEIQNHHRRGDYQILKLNSTSFLINLYKLVAEERLKRDLEINFRSRETDYTRLISHVLPARLELSG